MTIAMLSLAGFPATAGFFGKVYLIDAAVDNGYAWLGVVIVVGSAISLAYYLRVVAAVWMRAPDERAVPAVVPAPARPAIAGGSAEADADPEAVAAGERLAGDASVPARRLVQPEVVGLGVLCAAGTIFFGIYPSPLLDLARDAGAALSGLF
jgi:NADH-quinone oxidoreductase subunit N